MKPLATLVLPLLWVCASCDSAGPVEAVIYRNGILFGDTNIDIEGTVSSMSIRNGIDSAEIEFSYDGCGGIAVQGAYQPLDLNIQASELGPEVSQGVYRRNAAGKFTVLLHHISPMRGFSVTDWTVESNDMLCAEQWMSESLFLIEPILIE